VPGRSIWVWRYHIHSGKYHHIRNIIQRIEHPAAGASRSALDVDHALEGVTDFVMEVGVSILGRCDGWAVALDGRQSEAVVHLGLNEHGGTLVATVGVLLVDGTVVLLGALAAM
jgi:hypothetical protein